MINLTTKNNCTGCSACHHICPQDAIIMIEDNEGFLYPKIDMAKCIKCGQCKRVCPILNNKNDLKDVTKLKPIASYSKNEKDRLGSSSGGIFYEIANYILKNNGIVFGVGYDEKFNVIHKKVTKQEDLEQLKGSKYVQSNVNITYKEAKECLENNQYVLYVGTPCQVAGLCNFLGKDYSKLYTCDIICHGVPSPKIWREYIKYIQKKEKQNAKMIYFRNKKYGWNQFSLKIDFMNKKSYIKKASKDIFMQLFLKNIILRSSCYQCHFKEFESGADITIGDFWGIEQKYQEFSDNKGTSVIFINSSKGQEIFNKIKQNIIYKENCEIEYVIKTNPCIIKSVEANPLRSEFFKDFDKLSFKKVKRKYLPKDRRLKNLCSRIKHKLLK